jgi:uncharacterized protein YecE (DUF72 family)
VTHIGTAGWAIPTQYKDRLPDGGSQLERYAQRLNAVEINSSFHRHHRAQTYVRWAAAVPAEFRFAVKVPRALTHDGELTPKTDVLDRFGDEVRGLGSKLAVLLVQLPPKLAFDAAHMTSFVDALRKRIDVRIACEPRHASWGAPEVDRLLANLEVARVAADPAPWLGAGEPGGSEKLAYFRWHGQPRKYYSNYEEEELAWLRRQVTLAENKASDVWIMFDNTAHGCALGNALAMAADPM